MRRVHPLQLLELELLEAGAGQDLVLELVEQALALFDGVAGGGAEGGGLKPRRRRGYGLRPQLGDCGLDRSMSADDERQGRHELSDVAVQLAVVGRQLGETEVDQPGPSRRVDEDVGRTQVTVSDASPM